MGLFDKKTCDICGNKIGLLGNRKLDDGNLCKDCAAKLSPWFSERRHSTVFQIREQLAYREANREKVNCFHCTRTFGSWTKVMLDEDSRLFMVTRARDVKEANPDVLRFEDVTGFEIKPEEKKKEIRHKDEEGKEISYEPKRYEYSYDIKCRIYVNNPYFSEIEFRMNEWSIELGEPAFSLTGRQLPPKPELNVEYRQIMKSAEELKTILLDRRITEGVNTGKQPVLCHACGALAIPDANGCCEYCGTQIL